MLRCKLQPVTQHYKPKSITTTKASIWRELSTACTTWKVSHAQCWTHEHQMEQTKV